jgi:hypothetical protein
METANQETAETIWIISLVIGLVVTLIVAILLILIRNTARSILTGVEAIWTEGKLVANNTIQIPIYLSVTNQVVAKIYAVAVNIVGGSDAIKQHAEGCPGCPACVLEHKKES